MVFAARAAAAACVNRGGASPFPPSPPPILAFLGLPPRVTPRRVHGVLSRDTESVGSREPET